MAASEAALRANPFNDHPLCSIYYAAHHQRLQMQSRMREIRAELDGHKNATIKVGKERQTLRDRESAQRGETHFY